MAPPQLAAALAAIALSTEAAQARTATAPSTSATLTYRSVMIDGLKIFYREAGPDGAPTQADLFWSYQTNVAAYPAWQAWMRQRQPPMLVVWGRYDPSFAVAGAAAYKRAVPGAEVHILDAGHFALDEKLDEIAGLIRAFLARQPAPFGDAAPTRPGATP